VTLRIIRVLGITAIIWMASDALADSRSVGPPPQEAGAVEAFDPKQSAGLFVGVRTFPYDRSVTDVRYAVDDAVDLAFVFALDGRVRLIDPSRVILALSGEPQKPESQENLDRLKAAGAQVRTAGQADVLNALDEQARAATKNGMLVIAMATHGLSYDGTQFLLTGTSVIRHRETAVSESKIRDIASKSDAGRSLIFVDACRERLWDDRRNGVPDVRSAAVLMREIAGTRGQAVLSAAAAGQYAYDDDARRNGVFTAAVIDGLQCEAATDKHGLITVDTLAEFVERRVLSWIRTNRSVEIVRATQVTWDGQTRTMPLATCLRVATVRQSDCTIAIGSSPGGATVSLDGQEVGRTPVSVPLAKEQRGEVILVKSGYRAATADIDCSRSDPVFIALRPRRGKLEVLLSDNFDDNRNGWHLSTELGAAAELKNGSYFLGSRNGGLTFTMVTPFLDEDADFEISVTARYVSGQRDSIFGLLWGAAKPGNFWLFAISAQGNISVGSIDITKGGSALNDVAVVHQAIRTNGSPNRLKVAKVGTRLRFFVNESVVYEMDQRPFFGPGVGLITLDGPVVATLDDFRIEGSRK
jgi:hypothetical protein